MPMGAACGQRRMNLAAPYFSSPCPPCRWDDDFFWASIYQTARCEGNGDSPVEEVRLRVLTQSKCWMFGRIFGLEGREGELRLEPLCWGQRRRGLPPLPP